MNVTGAASIESGATGAHTERRKAPGAPAPDGPRLDDHRPATRPARRTPRGRPWLSPALAAGVTLVGLAISALMVVVLERQQNRHVEQSLDRQAELVEQVVLGEVQRYEQTLRGLSAAVTSQSELTAADYSKITSTISRETLLALAAVSLVVPVRTEQVPETERFWRDRGSTGLTLRPETSQDEHLFAVMTRTVAAGTSVLGRDFTSAPEIIGAVDRAAGTARPALSETYVLLLDRQVPTAKQQLSYALADSVQLGTEDGVSQGWLVMALRAQDFLTRTLRRISRDEVEVVLVDTSAAGVSKTVATWPIRDIDRSDNRHKESVYIPMGQRIWRLDVYATDKLTTGEVSQLPMVAGVGGLVITLLLAGLVLALASSRERAVVAVHRATAALEADILRREEVERQLRRREEELRGFAGVAAHDLKSPLATTGAHLEMLADVNCLDERAVRDVTRAREGIRRMSRLIEDLLSYATADQASVRSEPVDLGALVEDLVKERAEADGQPPPVETGRLPTVSGDPGMLRQLLDNLIGNALKYTRPGTRPEVSVRGIPLDDVHWRIEVADRGIGVPPESRATIFDAFRRANSAHSYPGTGLGLAICRRIVARHGGEIGVVENPGGGSVFWFTI